MYNANTIEVLNGLEPVKKRPGMYTNTSSPNHLAEEAIDNAIDEVLAGYATEISVILDSDNSITVIDNGRGIPVDLHPTLHLSGAELIFTKLHAGAKFSKKQYRYSGGLHGVGISVVNALSKTLTATIYRDQKKYQISFQNGQLFQSLHVLDEQASSTGTTITFIPDPQYFDEPNFQIDHLKNLLEAKSFLCSGLKINLITPEKRWHWCYQNGMKEYLNERLSDYELLFPETITLQQTKDDFVLDLVLTWTAEDIALPRESYVNLIPTHQGTHVNGFRSGILEAIKEFCELHKLAKNNIKLSAEDCLANSSYVLAVKMEEPQFLGQTKERLTSRIALTLAHNLVRDGFSLWLNQHVEYGKTLVEHCLANARKRSHNENKIARKRFNGPPLPGKLADCILKNLATELFIVEGNSAGGSAKQARDRNFQAVLPIRGKILNTWEIAGEKILASQEIQDIAIALGVEPNSNDLSNLRYGKICILADADSDGLHIATLLNALFLKHFLPLIQNGHIFVATPPLYRIDLGKEVYYALDDEEKDKILKKHTQRNKNVMIQRFKGLGEMNPEQLKETTMDPKTRKLVQIISPEDALLTVDLLLSKKRSADRRLWLETKGDLASPL